jgi:glycosyltransferase involved in cell wall biosynthesis
MIVIYLSRLLRIPVVGHMHGASFAEFYSQLPTTGQWLVAHAFRQTQRFIVLGSAPKAYFIDTVGLDPNRVTIVHNAVPCIGPVRGSRETMVPQLVFIGIMIERKGLLELLNALARLLHRPWALKIIGDGNAAAWQQIAHDLGVQDRVEFCGWQHTAAVHAVLAFSDILLLPSHNEGLPMVIIEAMAHACAVIATPVGSIKDVVEHNVTGFLVPPRDINALTEAIDRLLTEPGLRHRFGAAGRSRYLESLTMKRMNDQLESIFADAIHRG